METYLPVDTHLRTLDVIKKFASMADELMIATFILQHNMIRRQELLR